MSASRTVLSLGLLAALALSTACSRNAGDTDTNAAATDAPPAAETVAAPADAGEAPADGAMPSAEAAPAGDLPQPQVIASCDSEAAQPLIGQEATDAVLEQARRDSGSNTVRALKPGDAATMDFRADRLNVGLDEHNVIQTLSCG